MYIPIAFNIHRSALAIRIQLAVAKISHKNQPNALANLLSTCSYINTNAGKNSGITN